MEFYFKKKKKILNGIRAPSLTIILLIVLFVDGGIKPLYHKRKTCYNRESSQHDVFYKKRKLSDRNSVVTSDGGFSSESVTNSPEKNVDKSGSDAMLHGGP